MQQKDDQQAAFGQPMRLPARTPRLYQNNQKHQTTRHPRHEGIQRMHSFPVQSLPVKAVSLIGRHKPKDEEVSLEAAPG